MKSVILLIVSIIILLVVCVWPPMTFNPFVEKYKTVELQQKICPMCYYPMITDEEFVGNTYIEIYRCPNCGYKTKKWEL